MWVLIVIILILYFLFRPKRPKVRPSTKPAEALNSGDPIADRLYELIIKAFHSHDGKAIDRYKNQYINIKMIMLLHGDPRFTKLDQAFKKGGSMITPPDYIFTEKDHTEAAEFYNRSWWNFGVEFQSMQKLYMFRLAGATHVYIWPLDHRQCEAVRKIRKPKVYPIDEVPRIPCKNCTERCGCSYFAAKYRE